MLRRLRSFFIMMLSFLSAGAAGETVVEGVVTEGAKPLASVMVRLKSGASRSVYATTDGKGRYCISFDLSSDKVTLSFSRLGYETEVRTVDNASCRLDVEMSKSSRLLREVTVKAPDVRLRGDTVSYLLSAFAGKGDISLKDALRKIPGVEVAESGKISYNGKAISDFYIEGMDMLGGKYGVATTNIPASYVDAIEILNNHQGVKIDRRVFNDNVALNVRLKPKAKLRPVGTYEIKGGSGDRLLWEASGAAMLFRESFQTMLTMKGSDIEEFSGRDNFSHYEMGGARLKSVGSEILGDLTSSSAPVARRRWIEPIDASASMNFMNKLGKETSLRVNAEYSFTRTSYDYSDERLYFDGDSYVSVAGKTSPLSHIHNPAVTAEYRINSDDLYLCNDFSCSASFRRMSLPVVRGFRTVSQNERTDNYDLRDVLDYGWRRGRMRWNSHSAIEFTYSPCGVVDASGVTPTGGLMSQSATGWRFRAEESISGTLEKGRSSISFPVTLSFSTDRIHTSLSATGIDMGVPDGAFNRLGGHSLAVDFSPGYRYTSRYDRLVAVFSVPLSLRWLDWRNSGSAPYACDKVHFLAGMTTYLNYRLSYRSTLRFSASLSRRLGDIFDLATAPVMRDYMSIRYASGILSRKDNLNVVAHYDFKLPVSLWFANLDLSWSSVRNNLLPHQVVSSGLVAMTTSLMPNTSDSFSGKLGISKNIRGIGTKITLKGSCGWSREKIEQNGLLVTGYGRRFSLIPSLSSRPAGWLEVGYRSSFSWHISRYLRRSQLFRSQSHDVDLSCFPFAGFRVKVSAEVTRREITEGNFKTMSLFDAGMSYSMGKFRIGADLRNILDCKSYSYAIFSGLDRFSYDYALRGREFILSLTYTL